MTEERAFRVEHRDGTPWTTEEIRALRIPYGDGDIHVDAVHMDLDGDPVLVSYVGGWDYADSVTDDMVVIPNG